MAVENIINVTETDFEYEVLKYSQNVPGFVKWRFILQILQPNFATWGILDKPGHSMVIRSDVNKEIINIHNFFQIISGTELKTKWKTK